MSENMDTTKKLIRDMLPKHVYDEMETENFIGELYERMHDARQELEAMTRYDRHPASGVVKALDEVRDAMTMIEHREDIAQMQSQQDEDVTA